MAAWAAEHGVVHAFGIEGTGSYGAGLTRALTAMGLRVIEVGRVNPQLRRRHGKTDTVDAESAARAVLPGDADGEPKVGNGAVEMIRHLKIARDTALKARTQAMVTLKTLLVNAPQALRERFIVCGCPQSCKVIFRRSGGWALVTLVCQASLRGFKLATGRYAVRRTGSTSVQRAVPLEPRDWFPRPEH